MEKINAVTKYCDHYSYMAKAKYFSTKVSLSFFMSVSEKGHVDCKPVLFIQTFY